MDLSVTFLGTGSASPAAQRAPSSLLVKRGGDSLLFDCGEGTQRQLIQAGEFTELEHVFITHFHLDHTMGLPGMLTTFALRGRRRPLHIYGPQGLAEVLANFARITGRLSYPVLSHELRAGDQRRFKNY